MTEQNTRLEKLLRLLGQDGKTSDIRHAAAEQLAALAANQPSQTFSLVARVTEALLGQQWDGRVAAASCLEHIANHCEHHTRESLMEALSATKAELATTSDGAGASSSSGGHLDSFDVVAVMKQAKPLVASTGEEFAVESLRDRQTLQEQKKALKARLGLDGFAEQLVNTDDLIADEDLNGDEKSGNMVMPPMSAQMSMREIAMERSLSKRKPAFGTLGVKRPLDEAPGETTEDAVFKALSKANEEMWGDTLKGAWPFGRLADKLCIDLLHPAWETRHGAALGLRAILGSHADSAGIHAAIEDVPTGWLASEGRGRPNLMPLSAGVVDRAVRDNAVWLEDCAVHLLCVLALDQFGDFASDDVVAPVRETAAQVLGLVAASMPADMFSKTVDSLSKIARADTWEARHGALSGLKYVLAARSAREQTVPDDVAAIVLTTARHGLGDAMEDVRSVSAECLIPCVGQLWGKSSDGACQSPDAASQVKGVEEQLWDALLSLDPLNTGTKSAARLLQSIFLAFDDIKGTVNFDMDKIPRLLYQFSSKSSSTRRAALECYRSIVRSNYAGSMDCIPMEHYFCAIFSLIQVIVTDDSLEHAELAHETARLLVVCVGSARLWAAYAVEHDVTSAVFESALFETQKEFLRPAAAKLPKEGVFEELADGALETPPVCVTKDAATSRRSLVVSIAMHMSNMADSSANSIGSGLVTAAVRSSSGLRRQVGALAILAADASTTATMKHAVLDTLQVSITDKSCLDELKKPYQNVRQQFASVISTLGEFDLQARTVEELRQATSNVSDIKKATALVSSVVTIKNAEDAFSVGISCLLVSAWIKVLRDSSVSLPAKLNGMIQPLIAGVRREKDEFVQCKAAEYLAELIWLSRDRNPSPAGKIVKNLCMFACADKTQYPDASSADVLTDVSGTTAPTPQSTSPTTVSQITSRGGIATLRSLAAISSAAGSIESDMPCLWIDQILNRAVQPSSLAGMQDVVQACFLLEQIATSVRDTAALHKAVLSMINLLCIDNIAVQQSASGALSAMCLSDVAALLPFAFDGLDGTLKDGSPEASKFGGLLALSQILSGLQLDVLPFVPLLVVYLMRRMSDPAQRVRSLASSSFAKAVALMPLAQGMPIPDSLSKAQKHMIEKDGNFLEQLLNNGNVQDYELPFDLLEGKLRRYQQEGINWLAFLRRFGLHGVLADDMGLGKTVQSTSIMAATAVERRKTFESTKDPSDAPMPSLVVCPSTLVSHWPHEIAKFVSKDVLAPLRVHGTPREREATYKQIGPSSVVVVSYETMRSDISSLREIQWMYIILDEGHAIRNPTSKLSEAARELQGHHRLILSGTPVQNSVMEVWAMFEFLMPGYLGTRATFNAKFGKSVERAKKSRKTKESAQQQASILALQSLHKQVMPFILRRTKDQVLKDLPPKIIQDVTCEQSKLQAALLKDFDGKSLEEGLKNLQGSTSDNKGHVFQSLHFLRKVCSHPIMVLDENNEAHREAVEASLGKGAATEWNQAMRRIASGLEHSPKLSALKELLNDCGIGVDEDVAGLESVDAGHRVLIFAQTKAMLDLVVSAVLNPMHVSHLRIDGDVDAVERFNVVQKFNADPTIEVMLLTTSVGGLGLNLTTADTVIFMEHDWNPQKDLQAMDRAHRIGQTKCVSVYRLLVAGTIEESIMSLQRFKLDVAAAVVNADNMSMKEMDTGSLLDLFGDDREGKKGAAAEKKGLAAMLAELPSLEETDAQYQSEFGNVDAFVARVAKKAKD